MERADCAYLINTTPKYFYLLPLHIILLRRYAEGMNWPVYIATESPELLPLFDKSVSIIVLDQAESDFLTSRSAAVCKLPASIRYVFPIQEDFLLEGRPMEGPIADALRILDTDEEVDSLRLMPCPGPIGLESYEGPKGQKGPKGPWKILQYPMDRLIFTYQATLWRRDAYQTYMNALVATLPTHFTQAQKNRVGIKINLAEVEQGQKILLGLLPGMQKQTQKNQKHLAWSRAGPQPNAVYLCPWPYRPTAVVQGGLELWATQLAEREGIPLAGAQK